MKSHIQRAAPFGIGLIVVLGAVWYWNQPKCLRAAVGREGGDSHNFAILMRKYLPIYSDNKICLVIVGNSVGSKGEKQTDGTQENLEMLYKKEADLAVAQADILIMKNLPSLLSINGKPWNPPPPKQLNYSQLVSFLFPDMYQLVVRNDSGIKRASDLSDKRVAMPPREGGQIESFAFLMQYYGLIKTNQQLVKMVDVGRSNKEIKNALCQQKQIDAVFYVRAIDNDNIREILKECGRLVPIDQAAAITIKNPYLQEAEIPEGAYQGGNNPIPGNGADQQKLLTVSTPRLLLAHEDIDKDIIRTLVRILYEHRQEFIKEMPLIANMAPPDEMKGGIGLPIHPGAQAYYDREKPSWLEKYAESMGFIISMASIGLSGFLWLTQRFEQIRKNKADDYIREVKVLMDAEDCLKAFAAYLEAQKSNSQQLTNIEEIIVEKAAKILFEKRVAEIAHQKKLISSESLKSFGKTLRKVINTIEKLSVDISEKIFQQIPQKATELVGEDENISIDLWQKLFGVNSADELRKTQTNQFTKQDLDGILQKIKMPIDQRQVLQLSDLAQFLESETSEIRQDLSAIFKRAVSALVEERISQDSFQSFRVIWQVAAGDT
ncbi:MAG: TAXI family TRAP transporter solute-binding subunit [Calothrix sp. C42_A2020_038]|nr:TAXI family TRAP transporter solute-binding subunit [Calothrix sp. C42_A2020_038]